MSKDIPRIGLIALIAILATVWLYFPNLLSDKNKTLNNFFDGQMLAIFGFVISVTVASCLQIYLRLVELEKNGKGPFPRTKQRLRLSCFSLIYLFAIAFFSLAIKGMVVAPSDRWVAGWNAFFVAQMYFFISVMLDVARTSFKLP